MTWRASASQRGGSPGSHPHADRPNWKLADNIGDYFANCREGIEEYSDRRAAKILGVPRIELWRWKMMAQLPKDLFERLLKDGRGEISTKALAGVAYLLAGADSAAESERCWCCGAVQRVRHHVNPALAKIVADWLIEQRQQ